MIKSILLVGAGSFVGDILRYLLSQIIHSEQGAFPVATFLTNVLGSLLIGVLIGILSKFAPTHAGLYLLLVTGFCGGFTTFSTFSNEALFLIQNGNFMYFAMYVFGSLALGMFSVLVGYKVVALL